MSTPDPIKWRIGDSRSITHTFSADELDAFARLTGDNNPLHVDPGYARRSAAGGQVVHGMLAASFVSTLIGVHIPGRGALWNSFQVDWRKMIRVGDTLRLEARVTAIHEGTRSLELKIVGAHASSGDVYLEGHARVMMIDSDAEQRTNALTGKRVLVTGATGEVGSAICRTLVESGCQVVMWGRNPARLKELEANLGSAATGCSVDLMTDASISQGLRNSMKDGAFDGLVHAAAAPLQHTAIGEAANHQLLIDHWQIEVSAFHRIVQGLLPGMQHGGFIVAVLTQATLDAPPSKSSAYVAAKMGAWGLVRAMAAELGPIGIRCNAVSPGLIETPYVKDVPVRVKQVEAASNPLRRLCGVEDVANAVRFLSGPEAGFLNGVNLPVTGGARMP